MEFVCLFVGAIAAFIIFYAVLEMCSRRYFSRNYGYGFLLLFPGMSLYLFGAVFVLFIFYKSEPICSSIVEIGGCNKIGCGVKLANGNITKAEMPVIGQTICNSNLVYRWD